jgi:hypothetical protein
VIDYQGRYAGTVGLQPDSNANASVHWTLDAQVTYDRLATD